MLPVRFINPRSAVLAWDPLRQLDRLGRLFGQCDDGVCGTASGGFEVDVREEDTRYLVEANLPGFGRDEVEVTFQDGVLTIEAQTKQDEERKDENFHIRERCVGRVSRSFRLSEDVDGSKVNARMADGVLTVALDKAEAARPRTITVKAN